MKKNIVMLLIFLCFISLLSFPAQGENLLTFEKLMKVKKVDDPQVSPSGEIIVFTISEADLEENRLNSEIWLVNLDGKGLKQLTRGSGKNNGPQWAPDGKRIAFTSDRKGKDQIFLINIDGGEATQLTTLSSGTSGHIWSPDGSLIAFTSNVYYKCTDDEEQKKRAEEEEKSKVKARLYDSLLYRHWDRFRDDKRSHLFVIPSKGGQARDLTAGSIYDVPPIAIGGRRDYAFSPDSKEICYVTNTDSMLTLSTNNDLFVIPVTGGTPPRRITTNPANDNQPLYSPDGKFIAYRAMMTPRYEADRYRLMLYERKTGKIYNLSEQFDRSVNEVFWSPDSTSLFFTAPDCGYMSLYQVSVKGGDVRKLLAKSYNYSASITRDGKTIVFLRQNSCSPSEIYLADKDGKNVRQITFLNKSLIESLSMNYSEEFRYKGAGGTEVHGFFVKPPGFVPEKKYPVVFLIHGGPQQMWPDAFGTSWNSQIFAACGYVVVKINPRGSEGYGQKFCDEINCDWGGKPFEDLMKGADYLVANYPFVDGDRMAAAGASYGGYMINWIAGHTNRFKCLVSIAGCYNLISKYGATDELWFPEWDLGGTPWTNKEGYEKWSPHNYAQNFKTPTLVIHGQYDYRVPVTEGMQMFTALQRQNVPSRFLYFPDEGHWITKPQNLQLYFQVILDWLKQWL